MSEEQKLHDDLASIRSMMERSSKFISLSGLSGVLAGVYALIGAWLAYSILYPRGDFGGQREYLTNGVFDQDSIPDLLFTPIITQLIFIALAVLVASLTTGLALTRRNAKKKGQQLWGKTSKALLFQMTVPLLTGGAFIVVMLLKGYFGIVSPACLAFYGLALVGASAFTFNDVKYLGISEIILALLAAVMPGYGLLFWALGFGVLHIIYGAVMHFKYDR
ncbi:hypothetical protein [uncultured Mucilaginibacter sp.]|uniref:hypothetical protein n=1 Tax=uncultured Mucilaginibacter sp. TaxID=797541 RepID=UPI0025FDC72E|nr:hypothetical protein [uncultured Mucilaginibacter sp.]